jgi:hypothetical protein
MVLVLVTRVNTVPDGEDADRDLDQAKDNVATTFHRKPRHSLHHSAQSPHTAKSTRLTKSTWVTAEGVLGEASLKLGFWENAEDRAQFGSTCHISSVGCLLT